MQSDAIKAAWIGAGAVIVAALIGGAFLFVSAGSRNASEAPTPTNAPRDPQASSDAALTATASLGAYLSYFDTVKGRFSERDDFVKRTRGITVTWSGVVSNVSRQESDIVLSIRDTGESHGTASIWFGDSLATRLYGLRQGDVVEVVGAIQDVSLSHAFLVGESFRIVP
jgi:hypothetical protein